MPLRVPVGPIDLVYTKSQRHSVYVTEKSPPEYLNLKFFSGRYSEVSEVDPEKTQRNAEC